LVGDSVITVEMIFDVVDHVFRFVLGGAESLLWLVPKLFSLVLQLIEETHAVILAVWTGQHQPCWS